MNDRRGVAGTLHPEVRERVQAAMAAPDRDMPFRRDRPESVLSAETLGKMTNLVGRVREHLTPECLDIEAVYLAACYHCVRMMHVAPEAKEFEERATMSLFSVVHVVRPDVVPEPLRTAFAENPPAVMSPAEILHAVALTLFNDAAPRQDENGLWRAAGMIADALQTAPSSDSESTMMFNLGSVQIQLHKLTGQDDLLDRA